MRDSLPGQSEYEAVDSSPEARTGQKISYRLVRINAAGQQVFTPWFNVEPLAPQPDLLRDADETDP